MPRKMARDPDVAAGTPASPTLATPSKISGAIALLRRDEGATLAELVEATGWLPHTTRAALTGLRKKGQAITKGSRENATCYRIAVAA